MKTLYSISSRWWQVVVVVLLIALGTVGAGANSAYAAPLVPLTGTFSGTVAFTSYATLHFIGTGIFTLLGLTQSDGRVTITGPGETCPDGVANTNVETLTAANGDKLVITSYDVACPVSPGVFHGTGEWTVNGILSTGRFSGATGAGTLDGFSHFDVGTFTVQITGRISAPKGR